MVLIKKNKNIVAAFVLFSALTFVLIHKLSVPQDIIEVTVVEGDTLSELAERYAGDTAPDRWMREVATLNNLTDSDIIAGEDLKLPAHIDLEVDDTRLVLAEEER
ncbi:LysM peptidoglycan-binding domain-containing protein [Sporosarcina gallistercoris]|uniref:LysM peptidoglycan-binding domain-containing protein n=1 Tax=Sporosarcina gallistercoris TaxID=2762245 RepID=A0ABR8PFV9_9BACL|nr:LysM peptidoglycan-binding domain-containing protein [Sporosarcina gallistercoris]MBD7907047.1 LysM peptidoglycan-binding domain-containing protein [Sporosarcina gallistercoris]